MLWTLTIDRERQPFNPEPDPDGDFILIKRRSEFEDGDAPLSLSLSRLGLHADEILERGAATYMPHHATCPMRAQFRRERKAVAS